MFAIIAVLAFWLFAIIFFPMGVIWALNTLFALDIALNFSNWASTCVLLLVFGAASGNTGLKWNS